MKKFLFATAIVLTLGACQTTNQGLGTIMGGAAGGLLGNTIGKGSGNTAATIGGTLLGAIAGSAVGQSMDSQHQAPAYNYGQPTYPTVYNYGSQECSNIIDQSVRNSCERGVVERQRAEQRERERRAYNCSRYGRCY